MCGLIRYINIFKKLSLCRTNIWHQSHMYGAISIITWALYRQTDRRHSIMCIDIFYIVNANSWQDKLNIFSIFNAAGLSRYLTLEINLRRIGRNGDTSHR